MFIKNKYKFRGGKENEGIINKRDQDKQEHKERREERGERSGERRVERGESWSQFIYYNTIRLVQIERWFVALQIRDTIAF